MEAVAERAGTNKAAVYRRWPNKAKLVVAALHKHVPDPSNDVPDTGELRKDVLALIGAIAQPLQMIGAETIHGLMVEHLGKEFISSFPKIKHPGAAEEKWIAVMMTILKNAEQRGEITLKKISPRIILLPADLLRYELLTTHEPVSDETVTEIVDDIFLPLLGKISSGR
jgi:AcrR family transcriptional regulator